MPIAHDCTRQAQLVAFIECQNPDSKSGWFLDNFFNDTRSRAEKLNVRQYSKTPVKPLLYTGACMPPALIAGPVETATLLELNWPTIKAQTKITGCDVDEQRIDAKTGDLVPVGMQRFDAAFNLQMSGLIDGLRATSIADAITLLKTGTYTLYGDDGQIQGQIDYGRDARLDISFVGTPDDFCDPCSNPFDRIEEIGVIMAECGGVTGPLDIIHSKASWRAISAHEKRDAKAYNQRPGASFDRSFSSAIAPSFSYNDVLFQGETNGGMLRHWLNTAKYINHAGVLTDVIDDGDMLIVSRQGFGGQRIFRTVSSDGREEIPGNGLPMFIYDGIDEYEPKCRAYEPWIEAHPILIPRNVNGAALVTVTTPGCKPCVTCDECP